MRKLASIGIAIALSLAITPTIQANEIITPQAMDRIAVKCNVHKIWSVPSLNNYDGWVVVGHTKRHCLPVPIDRFPFEGLNRS